VGNHVVKVEKGTFVRDYDVEVTQGVDFAIETPSDCSLPDPPPVGTITGRVCAPDGTTWLAGANVSITLTDGQVIETLSAAEGHWTLIGVPAGTHVVTVVVGSFVSTYEVTVPNNGSVAIPEDQCQIQQNVTIAVVDGTWDDVKSVLVNVGIENETITDFTSDWAEQLLVNYDQLAEFDILFGAGISAAGCLLDGAEAVGSVQRRGSYYYYGDTRLGQGRENTLDALNADDALRRWGAGLFSMWFLFEANYLVPSRLVLSDSRFRFLLFAIFYCSKIEEDTRRRLTEVAVNDLYGDGEPSAACAAEEDEAASEEEAQ
jgi:hypothetical protein